jgi:hypothetical protein
MWYDTLFEGLSHVINPWTVLILAMCVVLRKQIFGLFSELIGILRRANEVKVKGVVLKAGNPPPDSNPTRPSRFQAELFAVGITGDQLSIETLEKHVEAILHQISVQEATVLVTLFDESTSIAVTSTSPLQEALAHLAEAEAVVEVARIAVPFSDRYVVHWRLSAMGLVLRDRLRPILR